MKYIYSILIIIGCYSVVFADSKITEQQLLARIEEAKKTDFRAKPREGDLSMTGKTLMVGGEDETWAILQLSKWEQCGRLNLGWWEGKDSNNRLLILLCLMSKMDEECIDAFLKRKTQNATRFGKQEAAVRHSEIKWARKLLANSKLQMALKDL